MSGTAGTLAIRNRRSPRVRPRGDAPIGPHWGVARLSLAKASLVQLEVLRGINDPGLRDQGRLTARVCATGVPPAIEPSVAPIRRRAPTAS